MCIHRETKFEMQCQACFTFFDCRHCHDTIHGVHHRLNIREVTQLLCKVCRHVNPIRETCANCGTRGGEYWCLPCLRFDDVKPDVFHCKSCNICDLQSTHVCISLIDECTICMGLFADRLLLFTTHCKHTFHYKCIEQMFKHDGGCCPLCRQNLRKCIPCSMCGINLAASGSCVLLERLPCGHDFHPHCVPEKNIQRDDTKITVQCPVCEVIHVKLSRQ